MVVGDIATSVDVVVLGAGPGGYVAAIRAAQLGKEVVIVSNGPLGGTCLNEGCIPSKALLTATNRAWQLQNSADLGIVADKVRVDFGRMQQWKQKVVDRLTNGVETLLTRNGVKVVLGKGWFINEGEIRVEGPHGSLRYMFEFAVIAVGANATPLADLPFDGKRILTPNQALSITELPDTLTIIGADYIAAELATIFSKLGVSTRLVIPPGEQFLNTFEKSAGRQVQTRLKALGVSLETKHHNLIEATQHSDLVVISMGITPRTAELNLNTADVKLNQTGYIPVNQYLQTNVPHLYAVGDVTGNIPLATFAIKQAKVAAESLAGYPVEYAPQALPRVAWTDPEIAAVGLTASQAKRLGYEVTVGRFPLGANGRALTLDDIGGSIITVSDKITEILLGITIVAPQASELINEAALALEMGATLTDLAETLHPHPGLGEALQESAEAALNRAVHLFKP